MVARHFNTDSVIVIQNVSVVALGAMVFGAEDRERSPRILIALVLVVGGATLVIAA